MKQSLPEKYCSFHGREKIAKYTHASTKAPRSSNFVDKTVNRTLNRELEFETLICRLLLISLSRANRSISCPIPFQNETIYYETISYDKTVNNND